MLHRLLYLQPSLVLVRLLVTALVERQDEILPGRRDYWRGGIALTPQDPNIE